MTAATAFSFSGSLETRLSLPEPEVLAVRPLPLSEECYVACAECGWEACAPTPAASPHLLSAHVRVVHSARAAYRRERLREGAWR